MTEISDLPVSNGLEDFSGLSCPNCASQRTSEIPGLIVDDLGDSFQSGTEFKCADCGFLWTEWDDEWD
jgi:transposase-like protein